jgi:hypothetical protein
MKVCIVGEGPVGLLTSLLFIYYKKTYNLDTLKIFLYKRREFFERRHVVNITKNIIKEIELLIQNCHNCLLKGLSDKSISKITMSINCLETILYEKIDKNYINIISNINFDEDQQTKNNYDHIFLCDGFQSKNREYFIYKSIKISPLKCIFADKVIFILYTNLQKIGETISYDCVEENVNKKIFNETSFQCINLDFDKLIAFNSIIYNINNRFNSLPHIEHVNLIEKNIWSSGFQNFEEFKYIFQETIKYINFVDSASIKSIFKNFYVNITDNMDYLFTYKEKFSSIFDLYKQFLYIELENQDGLNNPFMIHSVTPNCTSHGIILDDSIKNVMFARKIDENKFVWLLGDSANGYPPGHSLLIGLKDSFFLVKQFLNANFNTLIHPILLPENFNHFYCNIDGMFDTNYLSSSEICYHLKELNFIDGYLTNNNIENSKNKNIKDIIKIINTKTCFDINNELKQNDYLLILYNMYQLNNFFFNLKNIVCNIPNRGGKNKKAKKPKTRKLKNKKKIFTWRSK